MVRKELMKEFVGREVRVVRSTTDSLNGVRGVILDETKNTFLVLTTRKRRIIVPKNVCVFEIKFDDRWVRIVGKDIMMRPEDRTKM